ncbi:MAG: tripartite tricarboxylate transporter TctB family protein [Bacillota bacterium]
MLNSTMVSSFVFLIISVAVWQITSDMTEMGSFFPRVIAVIMGAFALIQIAVGIIQKKKESPFVDIDVKSVLTMVLGIVLYVALIVFFGFIIAGILFLGIFFWHLSQGDNKKSLSFLKSMALAALVCGGFFVIFNYVFLVPLPEGIIFGG